MELRPTTRAVALAAAGLAVALLPAAVHASLWPLWPVFLGGLVLGVGGDALLVPRRAGVICDVDLPPNLYIGAGGEALLRLRLPTRRPVPATLVVDLSELLETQPPIHTRACRRGTQLGCALQPKRRGVAEIERVWIRFTGPLGLIARVVVLPVKARTSIVPNILPVRSLALQLSPERSSRVGLRIERYVGDGTEFESLKEYVRGDDNRSIDWKASARHRQLVTRQHRSERSHQVTLVLDTGHLMAERLGGIPKLDHAVTAALLLAYVSLRAGDRVGMYTFDARVGPSLKPQGGMQAHRALVQLAAKVRYSHHETNFTLGLTSLASGLNRRSLVIVLTDFVDTVGAELMVENLHRLGRRHVVVFVALRDPELGDIASQRPTTVLRLSQAVVAARLIRDREVVLRRLRQRGIVTIDSEPRQINTRLINSYLEILRRERVG